MATLLERIRLLVRSEASELRERYEDAEKVVNQTIADAMVSYAKLKEDSASVFEGEAQARERVESLTQEAERWHKVARKALVAGNEADARLALSRRQDLLDRLAGPQQLYEQAHEVADKFRKRLAELEDGIRGLQAQSARIKAKESAARATTAAGHVASGSGTMDKLEEQADWQLAEAEGLAEAQQAISGDPFEELARMETAEQPAVAASVDDALRALREELEDDD